LLDLHNRSRNGEFDSEKSDDGMELETKKKKKAKKRKRTSDDEGIDVNESDETSSKLHVKLKKRKKREKAGRGETEDDIDLEDGDSRVHVQPKFVTSATPASARRLSDMAELHSPDPKKFMATIEKDGNVKYVENPNFETNVKKSKKKKASGLIKDKNDGNLNISEMLVSISYANERSAVRAGVATSVDEDVQKNKQQLTEAGEENNPGRTKNLKDKEDERLEETISEVSQLNETEAELLGNEILSYYENREDENSCENKAEVNNDNGFPAEDSHSVKGDSNQKRLSNANSKKISFLDGKRKRRKSGLKTCSADIILDDSDYDEQPSEQNIFEPLIEIKSEPEPEPRLHKKTDQEKSKREKKDNERKLKRRSKKLFNVNDDVLNQTNDVLPEQKICSFEDSVRHREFLQWLRINPPKPMNAASYLELDTLLLNLSYYIDTRQIFINSLGLQSDEVIPLRKGFSHLMRREFCKKQKQSLSVHVTTGKWSPEEECRIILNWNDLIKNTNLEAKLFEVKQILFENATKNPNKLKSEKLMKQIIGCFLAQGLEKNRLPSEVFHKAKLLLCTKYGELGEDEKAAVKEHVSKHGENDWARLGAELGRQPDQMRHFYNYNVKWAELRFDHGRFTMAETEEILGAVFKANPNVLTDRGDISNVFVKLGEIFSKEPAAVVKFWTNNIEHVLTRDLAGKMDVNFADRVIRYMIKKRLSYSKDVDWIKLAGKKKFRGSTAAFLRICYGDLRKGAWRNKYPYLDKKELTAEQVFSWHQNKTKRAKRFKVAQREEALVDFWRQLVYNRAKEMS